MKKLLGILLCVMLCLCAVYAVADSSGTCGTDVTWSLDGSGVLTISGTGAMTSHPWSESQVKQVVIESGVTGISNYAF